MKNVAFFESLLSHMLSRISGELAAIPFGLNAELVPEERSVVAIMGSCSVSGIWDLGCVICM